MGPTVTQESLSGFSIFTAGWILRQETVQSHKKTWYPWYCVKSPSELCGFSSSKWKTARKPHPFSMARSAVSAAQKSLHSLGSLSTNYSQPKKEACCSGSAVSFVVTSFIIMLASVQPCLSSGRKQAQSCQQQTALMQTRG